MHLGLHMSSHLTCNYKVQDVYTHALSLGPGVRWLGPYRVLQKKACNFLLRNEDFPLPLNFVKVGAIW
eukprot:jgi/Botrbrau1/21130/Bobra.0061s0024.1